MRRRGIGRAGRPSLVGTAARTAVIAGTATAVSGKVAAGQAARAQAAAPPPAPASDAPVAAAAAAAPTPVISDAAFEQLKKLGELRDAGILTEEEFAAKKAELLAG